MTQPVTVFRILMQAYSFESEGSEHTHHKHLQSDGASHDTVQYVCYTALYEVV